MQAEEPMTVNDLGDPDCQNDKSCQKLQQHQFAVEFQMARSPG